MTSRKGCRSERSATDGAACGVPWANASGPGLVRSGDRAGAGADVRRSRGRESRDARLGRARQAGAHVPARRSRARRLVVVHRALLRRRPSRRRLDLHRHGALGLARILCLRAVCARGARGRACGRRVRGGPPGRRRPPVRRARGDGPLARLRRRAQGRGDGRPALFRPAEPAAALPAPADQGAPRPAFAVGDRGAFPPHAAAALRQPLHPRLPGAAFGARGGRRRGQARLGALLRSAILGEVHPGRRGPRSSPPRAHRWRSCAAPNRSSFRRSTPTIS